MIARRQVHVEHALERQPAGVERAAEDRGDVTDDQRDGEDVAAGRVVAPLEKLRHRVDAAADVVRQENPDEQRVDDPGVPAPRAEDDAVLIRPAGVGDQVVAADVGGDHARADDVPGQLLVAEEVARVVLRSRPATQKPRATVTTM